MKKHVFPILLLLLLALCADAAAQGYVTLPELREQAAQGWHAQYTDVRGRTIPVDLTVNVFGQDEAPVVRIAPYRPYPDAGLITDDAKLEILDGGVYNRVSLDTPANDIFTGVKGQHSYTVLRTYGEKIDPDLVYGAEYGASYTPREMIDKGVEVLTRLSLPTDFFFEYPKEFWVLCRTNTSTGELVAPAIYIADYYRLFHGMPVIEHVGAEYGRNVNSPWFDAGLKLEYGPDGRYSVMQFTVREEELLAADIPLAPFADIVSTLEREIEAGHIRKVLSLSFGLVLYNDPKPSNPKNRNGLEVDCYYAMPTWKVEALYFDSAKKEDDTWSLVPETQAGDRESLYFRRLFVGAQTGKLLDPGDRSDRGDGDTKFHGFLSWDDVK